MWKSLSKHHSEPEIDYKKMEELFSAKKPQAPKDKSKEKEKKKAEVVRMALLFLFITVLAEISIGVKVPYSCVRGLC